VNGFDYRQRLYGTYVTGLASFVRDLSLDGIRRDFPIFAKTIGPFLPADKSAEILDIGCGYGALVFYLRSSGYRNARGVDRSPEMVSVARKLGIDGIEQAELSNFLQASPSRWALVTAIDVIEHFRKEEVLPLLDMAFAALAPGGAFVMQTPNGMSKYGRWERYGDFTHEICFEAHSARQCLIAAGFHRVLVVPVGPVVHGIASAIRKALWKLWEPWLKLSFAVEAGWEGGQVFTPNLISVGYKPG
jgi:2-polyprenyl-3-methyl-5-hydroxy-6-metoxy-1,4-benzoquinol methylase